jgi:hypothetical protein
MSSVLDELIGHSFGLKGISSGLLRVGDGMDVQISSAQEYDRLDSCVAGKDTTDSWPCGAVSDFPAAKVGNVDPSWRFEGLLRGSPRHPGGHRSVGPMAGIWRAFRESHRPWAQSGSPRTAADLPQALHNWHTRKLTVVDDSYRLGL